MNYRCHLWLAEAYEQHDLPGQAETLYNNLLEDDQTDEDMLRRLMRLYHQQGMKQLARKCYEDTRQRLHHLKQSFSPDLQAFAQHLLSEPYPLVLQAFSYTPTFSIHQPQTGSLSLLASSEDIMSNMKESEGQDLGLSRRYLLQKSLNMAQAALVTFTYPFPDPSLLERLSRALARPSNIDNITLKYLETCTKDYWQDHYNAALASCDLLSYVVEHLYKLLIFLEGSYLPNIRLHLCSIISSTALLVGTLLFDMSHYKQSRQLLTIAIQAAQEANFNALQAIAQGWISLTCIYDERLQEALISIQEGRRLATRYASHTVQAWLAAIEAEIQARGNHRELCLKALDEAELVEDSEEDRYWTSYDRVQLEGYKGVCFRLLYQPDKTGTSLFLTRAQNTLTGALDQLDPVLIRLRSTFLSDLAGICIQQREIEEACKLAHQALIMNTPKSQMIVQRVLALRRELEPWEKLQNVKDLDEQLTIFLKPGWYRGVT